MTGVAKDTVAKLLVELSEICDDYQDRTLRGLLSKRIQCDEIWSFVGCKKANVTQENAANGWGGVWTWTAIDPDTKLVVTWRVSNRSHEACYAFMEDLRARVGSNV